MKLIDADALDAEMYHKSFEVDDGRNVWNSGLWIRYKIFEEAIRDAPTIDAVPVEFVQKLFAESADFICDELTTIDRDWCERFCYHVEPQGSCFLKYYEEIWLPKQKGKNKHV